jgi:signal peptidase
MAEKKMSKRAKKARDAMKKRRKRRSEAIGLLKDVLIAFVIVIIVMASLWAFSGGIWPPMVVVESESMMHDDDSKIGVIDTGDLTIVKKIHDRHDIITYVEGNPEYQVTWVNGTGTYDDNFSGKSSPHKTYSDYGDVIIYKKNGMEGTPVIHRAMVWIEPNTTSECLSSLPMGYVAGGDFPDIKNTNHPNGLKCVSQLTLKKVGYKKDDVRIDVRIVMSNAAGVSGGEPFSGFLTKGDHNRNSAGASLTDQQTHSDTHTPPRPLAPIKVSWVVGKSVGELPWFGSLKLVMSKTRTADEIPPSSWRGLIITIVLILVIPFIIDMVTAYYSKKKKSKKKGRDEDEDDEEEEEKGKKRKGRGRKGKGRGGRRRSEPEPDDDDEELDDEDLEDEELEEEEEDGFDDDLEEEFEDMAKSSKKKRKRR